MSIWRRRLFKGRIFNKLLEKSLMHKNLKKQLKKNRISS